MLFKKHCRKIFLLFCSLFGVKNPSNMGKITVFITKQTPQAADKTQGQCFLKESKVMCKKKIQEIGA